MYSGKVGSRRLSGTGRGVPAEVTCLHLERRHPAEVGPQPHRARIPGCWTYRISLSSACQPRSPSKGDRTTIVSAPAAA